MLKGCDHLKEFSPPGSLDAPSAGGLELDSSRIWKFGDILVIFLYPIISPNNNNISHIQY